MAKRIFTAIVILIYCTYTTWKELEILSSISLILFLTFLYKDFVKSILKIAINFAQKTTQIKFKDIELNSSLEKEEFIGSILETNNVLLKILLSKLTANHIGLLFQIEKIGTYQPLEPQLNLLRELRSMGLITHNNPTLANSDEISLTELGKELIDALKLANVQMDNNDRIDKKPLTRGLK